MNYFNMSISCEILTCESSEFKFANKGIDALNVSNILNQKSVQNKIPPYFQYKESPCISYSYTRSVASKIFNNKASLQQLDFHMIPHLATALIQNFFTHHVAIIVTGGSQ